MISLEDFRDPENKQEIFEKISKICSPEMAYEFANSLINSKTNEKWIEDELDKFSQNLESFNENWKKLSLMFGQNPKKILKVRKLSLQSDQNYVIIRAISEILTRCGYCVRADEIVRCKNCSLAYIFDEDSDICQNCSQFQILE
jgi:hypothetical protein